jgi:hypothetical protein
MTEHKLQVYSCGHPNCGLLFIEADHPYPSEPYCPTRHESESAEQHCTSYRYTVDERQITAQAAWLDDYVRYTHYDCMGGVCCEFICKGYEYVYCPNCGELLTDAWRQMVDPARRVGKVEVA